MTNPGPLVIEGNLMLWWKPTEAKELHDRLEAHFGVEPVIGSWVGTRSFNQVRVTIEKLDDREV